MAEVIDGKSVAADVVRKVQGLTAELAGRGIKPGLAVVIVGEDPASQVYVASKSRTAKKCGFHSLQHTLPADASQRAKQVRFLMSRGFGQATIRQVLRGVDLDDLDDGQG